MDERMLTMLAYTGLLLVFGFGYKVLEDHAADIAPYFEALAEKTCGGRHDDQ